MIQAIIPDPKIERLRALINGTNDIVITCHMSPDGDAMGSTLGLCHVLQRLAKNVRVVVPDMIPKSLFFLPGMRDVYIYTKHEARAREAIAGAKLIFCLDFNTLARIDRLAEPIRLSRAKRVLIDHHLDPDDDFDLAISMPEASSTCELVFRMLMQMHMLNMVDRRAATCLYTGLMTDTGNFTYSTENPEVFEIAAALARRHIDTKAIYNMALNTFSADCLRLQGYAIAEKMQVFAEQHAALITLTQDELKRFNYHRGDTEGLVNKPLSIPGVNWVMFLREDAEYIKVSCRSVGDFAVSDICERYFNGGGHTNAAGGDFRGTMDEAVGIFYSIIADCDDDTELPAGEAPGEELPAADFEFTIE